MELGARGHRSITRTIFNDARGAESGSLVQRDVQYVEDITDWASDFVTGMIAKGACKCCLNLWK